MHLVWSLVKKQTRNIQEHHMIISLCQNTGKLSLKTSEPLDYQHNIMLIEIRIESSD